MFGTPRVKINMKTALELHGEKAWAFWFIMSTTKNQLKVLVGLKIKYFSPDCEIVVGNQADLNQKIK